MRLTNLRRSTPFRLALSFALLFILTVVATGGIMYHLLRNGLNAQLDTALNDTFQVVSSTYAPDDIEDLVTTLDSYANLKPADDGVYSLIDGSGKKLAGNFKAPILPEGVFTVTSADLGLKGSTVYRLQGAKLGQNTLVVGRSFAQMDSMLRTVLVSLIWAAVLAVLAAVGGGIFLASRAQKRLDGVARTMLEVSNGQLESRIPLRNADDDLDHVFKQINDALVRLAGLVEGMRQVSADIAHELKTPLNRLRLTLEEARQAHGEQDDVARFLDEAHDECDQINATFEALLRISQIEAGARRLSFSLVGLGELLDLVEDVYTDVAQDNHQRLIVEPCRETYINGDRELLVQMVVNLVENAIAHCPPDTVINVSLRRDGPIAVITVADTGPGIPAPERDKVFRRLYRLDKSRTRPGSGLGLSLVKAIADLHGARIEIEDNSPGVKISVQLPAL
ncbi:HAMP domain-containing sensor histidine kinase [Rhizobium sp. 57MFTsu3.2]|jgi:signal transduction histidine kinase|uniref:HAMP domain-containing sensor histidine kinase n=1 Tax=Rhizobium sp. 57MFTsu3.2 TaxID=1048681 RepID=UPI0004A318E2|nr:HAMP domain-containing sensor histidine kinase [Rhizobium sp. 57MFTsu3.2]NMN71875.1 signal transduction histidine kinase [Rhizobium sp. 57MFTsu3.2]